MEYITLGKTGLKVSRMGFGGIPIQKIDAAGTRALMEKLAAVGVNYVDSARGYTVSEAFLGEALEGMRDKFVIATKSMARTKEAMEKDIEISLSNFRTDYIDLYQIHNPSLKDLETVIGPGGALEALRGGLTPDAVLTDAEGALNALGELTGGTLREDVVGRIFERFCVGK